MTILSVPEGASVYTNGKILGKTPLDLSYSERDEYSKDDYIHLQFKKTGFLEKEGLFHISGVDTYQMTLNPLTPEMFTARLLDDFPNESNLFLRKILEIQGLMIVRNFEQAEELIMKFQKEYPNVAATYTMLGSIALERGQVDQAFEFFNRAVSLDKTDTTASRLLEKLKKAKVSYSPGGGT